MRRVGYLIDQIDLHGQNEELINELVELSKKHGILTPYTSFLADQDVALSDGRANLLRAQEETEALGIVAGVVGNAQRKIKGMYSRADAAPASSSVMTQSIEGEQTIVNTVRQIGNKSFFLKNNQWIESTLTEDQQANAIKIKQFSDEYFLLAGKQTAAMNQYLNFNQEVIVKLNDHVYQIVR